MTRFRTAAWWLAVPLASLSVAGSVAIAAGRQQTNLPRPAAVPFAYPVPGIAPAIAADTETVVAWLDGSEPSPRVRALAAPGSMAPVRLGPARDGFDGIPAAVALGDGSTLVVASRNVGGSQILWTQRHARGTWQPPANGPLGRRWNHHPAIAAAPGIDPWIVWVGHNDVAGTDAYLFASRWTGRAWGPAESLPRVAGAPMAPAIAVDADGRPVVVWAASNGADAEVWVSFRQGGSWSTPLAMSRNEIPDITPSIDIANGVSVVSWSTYTEDGYRPVARYRVRAPEWGETTTLSEEPGTRPVVVFGRGGPIVFWRAFDAAGRGIVRVSSLEGRSWSAPVDLVGAPGSPFGVAMARNGRLSMAWTRPDGLLALADGSRLEGSMMGTEIQDLVATLAMEPSADPLPPNPANDAADVVEIPESYTAFGDSITNGVLVDPVHRPTSGYRGPLQEMLQGFFGFGVVLNAGADGEETDGGVNRVKSVVRDQNPDAILIMEGTNDITFRIDAEVIAFNLRRIIERAREEKPDIVPFLGLVIPRNDPTGGFDSPENNQTDELNARLPGVAAETGATLVDLHTPMDQKPELMSDHVHPSEEGFRVMAETWFAGVKPVALDGTNRGDADGSGRVDGVDLVRLALAFGAMQGEERYNAAVDINHDGIVDGFDLNILAEFFGAGVSGS